MTTERGHEIKHRGEFPGGRCGDARGAAEPLLTDLEPNTRASDEPAPAAASGYVGQPVGGRWADMAMHVEDAVVLFIVALNASAFAAFIVASLLVQ